MPIQRNKTYTQSDQKPGNFDFITGLFKVKKPESLSFTVQLTKEILEKLNSLKEKDVLGVSPGKEDNRIRMWVIRKS